MNSSKFWSSYMLDGKFIIKNIFKQYNKLLVWFLLEIKIVPQILERFVLVFALTFPNKIRKLSSGLIVPSKAYIQTRL